MEERHWTGDLQPGDLLSPLNEFIIRIFDGTVDFFVTPGGFKSTVGRVTNHQAAFVNWGSNERIVWVYEGDSIVVLRSTVTADRIEVIGFVHDRVCCIEMLVSNFVEAFVLASSYTDCED